MLTVAVGMAILTGEDLAGTLRRYAREHPTSYGPTFWRWATEGWEGPYGSWANGASMRVSACAWLARDLSHCLELAEWSATVPHDHPEAVRGARATALATYLARDGLPAADIRRVVAESSGYDLSRTVDEIRPAATFELKSWVSVPEALTCALEATSYEDAVRNAVSLGADADTQAAIAGAVAEGLFGVPAELAASALARLPAGLRDDLARLGEAARPPVVRPGELAAVRPWDPAEAVAWNRRLGGYDMDQADRLEAMAGGLSFDPGPPQPRDGIAARLLRLAGLR